MAATLDGGKLTLSGYVGDLFFGDGFTPSEVVFALAQVDDDDDLTVYINSPGGHATEGAAIHALLSRRSGRTDVVIDGVAASAASLIAMAGKTVTMSAGAVMMIHDPAGITAGNSDDHSKAIAHLEALATAYARVYAGKSGKTPQECREIMKAVRWLTPEEAVAEGFADATTETQSAPVAAFDYRVYAHAPKELTALTESKNWSLSETDKRAVMSAASPRRTEEPSMTDKERADQLAAELATMKAQMSTAGTDAVKADRDRRTAIMALEETTGREALAEHLYATGKNVDEAKATLAVSAKATVAAAPVDDAAALEARRLNGEGLSGKPAITTAQAPSMVANMRKLLGQKEVA